LTNYRVETPLKTANKR